MGIYLYRSGYGFLKVKYPWVRSRVNLWDALVCKPAGPGMHPHPQEQDLHLYVWVWVLAGTGAGGQKFAQGWPVIITTSSKFFGTSLSWLACDLWQQTNFSAVRRVLLRLQKTLTWSSTVVHSFGSNLSPKEFQQILASLSYGFESVMTSEDASTVFNSHLFVQF